MGHGHTLFGSDRDNRLDSMALSADGERVVFGGYADASNDGSFYGSVITLAHVATKDVTPDDSRHPQTPAVIESRGLANLIGTVRSVLLLAPQPLSREVEGHAWRSRGSPNARGDQKPQSRAHHRTRPRTRSLSSNWQAKCARSTEWRWN